MLSLRLPILVSAVVGIALVLGPTSTNPLSESEAIDSTSTQGELLIGNDETIYISSNERYISSNEGEPTTIDSALAERNASTAGDEAASPEMAVLTGDSGGLVNIDDCGVRWELTVADDFTGSTVDQAKWNVYNTPGHNNNGLRRPEAITVEDGNLVISAQMVDGILVSGGMATVAQQTYGRYEVRVRTERDPAENLSGVVITWPADNNYPAGGENNIYETGSQRSPFYTFVHYPDTSHLAVAHLADATQWQTMRMEWSSTSIDVYRNDTYVESITDQDAIPDVDHHLTLQLDAFQPTMGPDPVRLYVDWIRVYRNVGSGAPCER